jgi:hypothetical protein
LSKSDLIVSHDLPQRTVDTVIEILSKHQGVKEAYLYRKIMEYLPDQKFYVLAIVPGVVNILPNREEMKLEETLKQEIQFPGTYQITVINSATKWMKDNAATMPTALVYKRDH